MPQFSLAHLTVLACTPAQVIEIAADAGYDYVSLRPISMKLPGQSNFSFAENPSLFRETRDALKATGLKIHDIELARLYDGLDARAAYEREIALSAELGSKAVLSSVWNDNRQANIDQYGTLCDIAKPYGMTVDLEFVCIANVRTLAGVVDIVRTANRPNCGVMIDMLHFHASGDNPADLDGLPAEWFHFAHVNDAVAVLPKDRAALTEIVRDGRLYLGEGGIDLPAILGRLPAKTIYSMELPNAARVAQYGYAEHAKRVLTTAKAYLAQHAIAAKK